MKITILFTSVFIIIINTFASLIIPNYQSFNVYLVDISIAVSCANLLILTINTFPKSTAKKDNEPIILSYRIGLLLALVLTGFSRLILSLLAYPKFDNNFYLIIILSIILFEVILIVISKIFIKHIIKV